MKSKRFAFTYLRPNVQTFLRLIMMWEETSFLVFGLEEGQHSHVVHLQGYIELKEEIELFALKHKMPGFYMEIARESREINVWYCTKECGYSYLYDKEAGIYKNTFPPEITGGIKGGSLAE